MHFSGNEWRPKNNFSFPPTGKDEQVEGDRSRLRWVPPELDDSFRSYSFAAWKHDPGFFIVILVGLHEAQETQLTSTDNSHEVEGLFWLDLGDHRQFVPVAVFDITLHQLLLGRHYYPKGLSRVDADEVVLTVDAWASRTD